VTLSHAGPNSIYNCEKISHKFSKTVLDINKLNYIHVSAGSHKVPIRNLVICFEPVSHLHPSFDKDFKKSDLLVKPIKLIPCHDSINCLRREDNDHMKKYSHPCEYAELCRHKNKEPYLTHESYVVDNCSKGQSCKELDNPAHRAKYRHIGMPDFLISCRYQQQCHDKSYEHCSKYSHGEYVELSSKDAYPKEPPPIPLHDPYPHERKLDHKQRSEQIRCRDGLQCRKIHDAHHCSKYSHSDKQHHRSGESNFRPKISCDYGIRCRDIGNPDHCSKYSHPDY
jgi:hypothetical protein